MKDKSRYLRDLRKMIQDGEVDLRIIDTLNILNSKEDIIQLQVVPEE